MLRSYIAQLSALLALAVIPDAFADARSAISSGGGYVVDYSPSFDPMPLNRLFSLNIVIKPNKQSGSSSSPFINVDARMPTHNHGMNTRIVVRKLEKGHYRADGLLFHMPGHWRITIDLTDERNLTEQVVIDAQIQDE